MVAQEHAVKFRHNRLCNIIALGIAQDRHQRIFIFNAINGKIVVIQHLVFSGIHRDISQRDPVEIIGPAPLNPKAGNLTKQIIQVTSVQVAVEVGIHDSIWVPAVRYIGAVW